MALLKYFMYRDQGFERLNFVREDWLYFNARPEGLRGLVVPCIDNTCPNVFPFGGGFLDARRLANIDRQIILGSTSR